MALHSPFHGPHFHLPPELAAILALPAALLLMSLAAAAVCSIIRWS
jgi:hypothetical protein